MSPAERQLDAPLIPIEWDPQPAIFHVCITGDVQAGYTIGGRIWSAEHEHGFDSAWFVTGALILWRSAQPGDRPRIAAFDTGGADRWMAQLWKTGPVAVPAAKAAALAEALANSDLARLECPDELRARCAPKHRIRSSASCVPRPTTVAGYYAPSGRLDATLSFAYGETEVDAWSVQRVIFDPERRVTWRREREAERGAVARLQSLGVRRLADWETGGTRLDLSENVLPTLVRVATRGRLAC